MDASNLLSLFIYIIVIACAFGIALYIVSVLPIPEPFKGWARVAVLVVGAIFVLFWLLSLVGGGPTLRFR